MFGGARYNLSKDQYCWKRLCGHWTHCPPPFFGCVNLPQLGNSFFHCFFPLYTFEPSFKLFSIFSFSFTLLQSFHSNLDRFWVPGRTDPYTHPRKTPSKNCISPVNSGPNDINPNVHLSERATYQKLHSQENFFPEFTLARVHTWPKLNFPENLFSKIYTCQISHWAEITFSENLFSRIRTCQNFYIWSKLLYHENLFIKTLHISRQIETLLSRIYITQNLLAHLCLHLTLKLRVE